VKKRKDFAREFIREHFLNKPAAILEIGCGAGRNLEEILSQDPQWKGTGVDNASAMIEHCRKKYQGNPQMSFEMLDIDSTALDRQFDVILLLGVIGYLDSNKIFNVCCGPAVMSFSPMGRGLAWRAHCGLRRVGPAVVSRESRPPARRAAFSATTLCPM
jgi:2-polyprenyl-3-methyl-5-hydroxy-6-metoxy-1,4-benzoquinol methylase